MPDLGNQLLRALGFSTTSQEGDSDNFFFKNHGLVTEVRGENSDTDDAWGIYVLGKTVVTKVFNVTKAGVAYFNGNPVATVGTPALTLGTANAAGVASTSVRTDATILAFDATVPVTQAYSDAAATGSATVTARRDHKHGMPAASSSSGGTPALVLSTANTAGVAATFIRTDDTILAFDATVPVTQASADAAATGSAAVAARRDHKHGMPVISSASGGTPALVLGTANTAGVAATFIRTDDTVLAFDATVPAAIGTAAAGSATTAARRSHVHPTGAGTPTTQAFSDAAATGTGPAAAMTDHKHAMPAHAAATSGHVIKEIGHETRGADGTDSTTSTSYVDIGTSASVTMTCDASDKMTCVTSGTFYNTTAFAEARIALRVDAVAVANGNVMSQRQGANGGIYAGLSLTCQFTGLSAASHTVEQQWQTDSGTFFSYSGASGGKSLTVWRHA